MPEVSVAVRVYTGELLQQEFFAAPAFDAVCVQPPSYMGNRRSVWHVAVAGLKGAAGSCLEVLEVQTWCARCLWQKLCCQPEVHRKAVLSLHPGQWWKQPAGHWDWQGPSTPGAPCPALIVLSFCMPSLLLTSAWRDALPLQCYLPSSLHPSLRAAAEHMDGFDGERDIRCSLGTGVVQVCWYFDRVGTQEKCCWNIPQPQPWACQLCNSWAIVTRGLAGLSSVSQLN